MRNVMSSSPVVVLGVTVGANASTLSLDAIASTPAVAAALPTTTAWALYHQAIGVLQTLLTTLQPASPGAGDATGEERLLTVREVAAYLKVARSHAYQLIRSGGLPRQVQYVSAPPPYDSGWPRVKRRLFRLRYPRRIVVDMTGKGLRRLRKQLGLTQAQFATQLGVHPNTLARAERGEHAIRESVARFARLLAATTPRQRPTRPPAESRRRKKRG